MSPELILGIIGIGVAVLCTGLAIVVKGRRGGMIVIVIGGAIGLAGIVLLYNLLKQRPSTATVVVVRPTPPPIDWGVVLMRGDPVIVEIEDSTAIGGGNSIEHRPYTVSFNRERCEWTVVGPMYYEQFGLVENHRRVYGPLIL